MQNYIVPVVTAIMLPILAVMLNLYKKNNNCENNYTDHNYSKLIQDLNKNIYELREDSTSKEIIINDLETKLFEVTNNLENTKEKVNKLEQVNELNLNKLLKYENKFKQINAYISDIELIEKL